MFAAALCLESVCRIIQFALNFNFSSLTRAVYHVGPNGWTQVWAGDTTDMFYKYYPIKDPKSVETESDKKAQEAASMSFSHGA